MSAQPAVYPCPVSTRILRRRRIVAVVASAALLCSGATSCTKTQVTLSITAIAAIVVGTTVGVTLAVQHSHHTAQGCISSGANGLELHLNDGKIYTLKGELADVKVGDRLKLHGSKVNKLKGNPAAGPVFVVEKVNKDYGACPAGLSSSPAPAH